MLTRFTAISVITVFAVIGMRFNTASKCSGTASLHLQETASRRFKLASLNADEFTRFERLHDASDIAPANPEHAAQLLLRERDFEAAGAINRRQHPTGETLFNGVRGVTGDVLKKLRHRAIGVAREEMAQNGRLQFRFFERRAWHSSCRTRKLH